MRREWIDSKDQTPMVTQCELAGVSRSTVYANLEPKQASESDLLLCSLIDEEYTRHPCYGSRKMVKYLKLEGHIVNRKRVQRLMRQMGLVSMAPGPNTSRAHPEHKVYPYLLRGVEIVKPNQVWSTDITYIRLPLRIPVNVTGDSGIVTDDSGIVTDRNLAGFAQVNCNACGHYKFMFFSFFVVAQ